MRPITVRDESSGGHGMLWLVAGALVGAVGGVLLSERLTLFGARAPDEEETSDEESEVDGLFGPALDEAEDELEDEELEEKEEDDEAFLPTLDRHVLEAYANDPILSARPIEIEETASGVISLTGRVRSAREIAHAVTIARGIPGVREVRQRLTPRARR